MKIGFIGAGKAGTAVAGFLKNNGLEVTGFHSRRLESAVDSAVKTDTKAFPTLEELIEKNDAIVISTSDDAIRKYAIALGKRDIKGKILCHMSESYPGGFLNISGDEELTCLSMHPPYVFHSKEAPEHLAFVIEGSGPRAAEFQEELQRHSIDAFSVTNEQKYRYHLALSFMATFTVTLIGMGRDMLRSVGIQNFTPFEPLLTNSICPAICAANISDTLGGPIATEDIGALKRHKKALAQLPPDFAQLYKLLAENTLPYTRLDNYGKARIREVLRS